jgi:hypothetical protein
MGYWKELYTIAQNVVAQKGMNIDLHGEIAKSLSFMNTLGSEMDTMGQNTMPVGVNPNAGDTISPEMGQTPTEPEMML